MHCADTLLPAISIHALRKESDQTAGAGKLTTEFQSTLSVRRATECEGAAVVNRHISIHALRKESDSHSSRNMDGYMISIHALRKESDVHRHRQRLDAGISIHALRKESDHLNIKDARPAT